MGFILIVFPFSPQMAPLKLYYFVHQRSAVSVLPVPRPLMPQLLAIPKPKKRVVVVLKKKVKRLRLTTKERASRSNLVNGVHDALQNGSRDTITATTTTTTTTSVISQSPAGVTSQSRVPQCGGVGDDVLVSMDTTRARVTSTTAQDEAECDGVKGVGVRTVSPTNNNESAVSSPCKNCPKTACAHAKNPSLRLSLVTKDLSMELDGGESSPSTSDSESGQSSGTDPSNDSEDNSDTTVGGDTGKDVIKAGFSYRKVVAPNFSGVLKIPIVQRKIMSPTQLGGVVRAHAQPELRSGGDSSPEGNQTVTSHSNPPPVSRVTTAPSATATAHPSNHGNEAIQSKDTVTMNGNHGNTQSVANENGVQDKSNTCVKVDVKSSLVNGKSKDTVEDGDENTEGPVSDTLLPRPGKIGVDPSCAPLPVPVKQEGKSSPTTLKPSTPATPKPLTPATPKPLIPATPKPSPLSRIGTPSVHSRDETRLPAKKPVPARVKKCVGAHGGSPANTPPRSPSRSTTKSPQPILPKGHCGPMAHGCLPVKRPSPPGFKPTSPPKRMRLNVCHGVQNIQNTVSMTTSAIMPHTPTIAHSGQPLYMTSVTARATTYRLRTSRASGVLPTQRRTPSGRQRI